MSNKAQSNAEPLEQEVWRRLRSDIRRQLRAGDRLDTVVDLARGLQVSTNTIRMAISRLQREGWVVARRGSGTYATARVEQIRVGVLCEQDLLNPAASFYWRELPRQLRRCLREHDVLCRLYVGTVQQGVDISSLTCWDFLEDAREGRLDAVAALGTPDLSSWRNEMRGAGIPVVGANAGYDASVGVDVDQFLRDGFAWLKARGCRRVALMSWNPRRTRAALQPLLAAAGLDSDVAWIRTDLAPGHPGAGWQEFREIWFARENRPDGLLVEDDVLLAVS